ncbi:hypothetical protein Tco_0551028, partial [Tanacetum coccineum]
PKRVATIRKDLSITGYCGLSFLARCGDLPVISFGAEVFGGDLFSASESISKPSSSSTPTQTASIPPASSAIVPATSEPQTPAKIDPLDALNAFTRQPTGAPVQSAGPSLPRPNQQARLKIQKEHKFPTHHYLSGQK